MLAFSEQWLKALAEALKKDEKYQAAAKGFDSKYQFVVEPEPEKGVNEEKACGLMLPATETHWMGKRDDADYVMTGKYGTFKKIMTGELGATMAITLRKVNLKGNVPKLLKYTSAVNQFVKVLQTLPVDWEGDFAKEK